MINDSKYFKDRQNNKYTKYTKEEIRNMIDPFRPETFIFILKDMNYPYFEREWGNILSKSYKNYRGIKAVIGKYIAKMQLKGYKIFTFKDSRYHKELQEFSLEPYGLSFDEERRLVTIFDNKELLPIWNYKKPIDKDYKEIILFLLDELENEHMGMKDFYIQEIQNKYNIDF